MNTEELPQPEYASVRDRVYTPVEFDGQYGDIIDDPNQTMFWGCATVSSSRVSITSPWEVQLLKPSNQPDMAIDLSDKMYKQMFNNTPWDSPEQWVQKNRVYGVGQAAMEVAVEMGKRVTDQSTVRQLVAPISRWIHTISDEDAWGSPLGIVKASAQPDEFNTLLRIFKGMEGLEQYFQSLKGRGGIQVVLSGMLDRKIYRGITPIDDRGALVRLPYVRNSNIAAVIPLGPFEETYIKEHIRS